MAGKTRNNKRSSSSYTSTITIITFVALCVVGVWMLSSNTIRSAQTTNRTAESDSTDLRQESVSPESSEKKGLPVYEDNPGNLPADAIKSDDGKSVEEGRDEKKDAESDDGDGATDRQEKVAGGQENQQEAGKASEKKDTIVEVTQKLTPVEEKSVDLGDKNDQNQTLVQENDVDSGEKTGENDRNQLQEDKKQDGKTNDESQSGSGSSEGDQDAQKLKSFDEMQKKLRMEDAGAIVGSSNSEDLSTKMDNDHTENNTTDQMKDSSLLRQSSGETTTSANMTSDQDRLNDVTFPGGGIIPKESKESKKSWSTQAAESENQKERRKDEADNKETFYGYSWQLCNVTAGPDYIPCLDNEKALKLLHSTKHYEHRERHCPEQSPTCLVTLPDGYRKSIPWPQSRDKIWYFNVPHTKLAEVKGHQNWVKVTGEFLTFPGGGTQFIHGATHYIEFVQEAVPEIAWGKRTRVILDVGCGVASLGGYLFDKGVLTMSFAPKDEHEAQVQFALERGIPAISAVMGSQRLLFPSMVFDVVHCARCRVPWHAEGGLLLLELNRVLRPGGFFIWSATPVYQKLEEDVQVWKAMSALTASMCWDLVTIKKDKINSIGAAIYRKPISNDCYEQRNQNNPPMCKEDDDPNAAWYVPLQACMHRVPVDASKRGSKWPEEWPGRLQTPPYWLNSSQMGIYGKPAPQDFAKDYEHWKNVVSKTYMKNMGISWSNVRNVMDMRAVYGGFAAALKDLQIWVMNVVNVDSPDTLPIIYERGLFGIYHDWCESFSTYPRTYDLVHADHLFSILKKRCKLTPVLTEVDRIVRPGGKLIIRDESRTISEVENILKSLRWEVHLTFSKDQEGLLSAQKGHWRPKVIASSS